MKLDLVKPALILVILGMAFGLFKQCDDKKRIQDEAFLERAGARQVEDRQNMVISSLRDTIQVIRAQRSVDSAKHLKALEGLQMRNKAWSRKYSDLKAEIKPIADSLPVVAEFQKVSDSLLALKDSIILTEQRNSLVQYKSFTSEIRQLHGQIEATELKSEAWRESSVSFERKARKQERRKKAWRTAALILGGAVGVLLVSQK